MPFDAKKTSKTKPKPRKTSNQRGKAVSRKSDAIIIPTKPRTPAPELTAHNLCIYGEKGVGKTTLAAEFKDVVAHFFWEPGRRDVKSLIIPQDNEVELTWPRFQEYIAVLLNDYEPGRIIVDTLDLTVKAFEKYWCAKKGVQSLYGVNDHGKTWDQVKDDWWNVWQSLFFSDWRVTFLSHAKNRPRNVKGATREQAAELAQEGVISSERQPTARPWAVDWMKIPVAIIGYYGWYGTERVLHIRGSGDIFASPGGDSENHFLQPKGHNDAGTPYHALPMGTSPQTAYKNLEGGWRNKIEGYCLEDMEDVEAEE